MAETVFQDRSKDNCCCDSAQRRFDPSFVPCRRSLSVVNKIRRSLPHLRQDCLDFLNLVLYTLEREVSNVNKGTGS